jgi:hypothetical protein
MNTIKPFHAPQILLDQFQRPVAPIPGATMLEVFSLQILCSLIKFDMTIQENEWCIRHSINLANQLLNALQTKQSESQIAELKIIDNE